MRRLLFGLSALCGILFLVSVFMWLHSYSTGYVLGVRFARPDGRREELLDFSIVDGEFKLSDRRQKWPGRWSYDSITWARILQDGSPPYPRSPLWPTRFEWRTRGGTSDCWDCTGVPFTTVVPLWSFALLFMIGAGIWPLVALRRVRRRRKGRCSQCGYDLTGNVSGRCPECGSTVAREGRAPQSA
jgi:predicted RNA-binding Zn-ribbon protein involved in translation (DUF1610 family)